MMTTTQKQWPERINALTTLGQRVAGISYTGAVKDQDTTPGSGIIFVFSQKCKILQLAYQGNQTSNKLIQQSYH